MIIPDVINTLLMGLIFMVIVVTVVRPLVLNMIGDYMHGDTDQADMMRTIEQELERASYKAASERSERIRFQQLLIELPARLQPKPVPEPEPEVDPAVAEAEAAQLAQEAADADATQADVETVPTGDASADADSAAEAQTESLEGDEALGNGEIEIREGESLAEIKERIKREQKNAKKPTIPPELLNNAKSYEDKVGVVRMVVQQDQSRVAAVIRGMIQTK